MAWRNGRQSQGGQGQGACGLQGTSALADGGSRGDDVVHHQDRMVDQLRWIRNCNPARQPTRTVPAAARLDRLGSHGVHDQCRLRPGVQTLPLQGLDQRQKDRLQMNPPPPPQGGSRGGGGNHQNRLRGLGPEQGIDQPGQDRSQTGHDLAQGSIQGPVVMVLPCQNDSPDGSAIWSACQGQTKGIGGRRHQQGPEEQRSARGAEQKVRAIAAGAGPRSQQVQGRAGHG